MTAHPRRLAALGTALATLLLVTACSSGSDDLGDAGATPAATDAPAVTTGSGSAPANSATAATSATVPADGGGDAAPATTTAAVVPEALQFTAPLVGGGEFRGADVADRPTVFWFWAPT